MIDFNKTLVTNKHSIVLEFCCMLILSLEKTSRVILRHINYKSVLHTKTNSGEMQGDERSTKAPESTYGNRQNCELHRAMQRGTVPNKKLGK